MDFGDRDCILCGREGYKNNMIQMKAPGPVGWRCRDGECLLPKSEPISIFRNLNDQRPNVDGSYATAHHVPLVNTPSIQETEVHPLQEEFGFKKPEDGSERRFVFNAVKQGEKQPGQKQPVTVPWVKFRFWWLVHNAVAHPLIAVAPRRRFFEFHDYTSRKMHGK